MTHIDPNSHDFRHADWDAINDSERQRQFRKIAPMPFGAVPIMRDDMDENEVRWHLKTMKKLGYNAIKQFMGCDRWPSEKLEQMALEEGLCPWWYGEGGWEPITDELCGSLGIDPSSPIAEIRKDTRMLEHQKGVLAKRFGRPKLKLNPEAQEGMFAQSRGTAKAYGTNPDLPEWAHEEFMAWCEQKYDGDISKLNAAWNMDGSYAKDPTAGYPSFADVPYESASNKREYGRVRDVLRFKADLKVRDVLATGKQGLERDPHEPHRSGGEMGLFLPFASRGTDMAGIASAMKDSGSFYPSIHLCWHFEETHFEVAKPVFMQASFVVDLNKGGWTAPWESTGGPQQTSGSNAPLFEWVRDRQPGYTVDAGVMTQLLYSYLGAGCRGVGLWSWNARQAGVEAGEYALLDRNEEVCERTIKVGQIAQACDRYRDEIWAAHKEPQVGILMDWNNEAIWAAMAQFNRSVFKHYPIEARIGACRTCLDAGIPFEYVTAEDLRAGLASRYPVIYLPGMLGLSTDLLPLLLDYAALGGRVVLDMPGGGYDENGRMLRTGAGTAFHELFGAALSDLQYSGNNVVWSLDGEPVQGYTADLIVADADVSAHYNNGRPAVTEKTHGSGSAVLLGWEAGRNCYRIGNDVWQKNLAAALLGGAKPWADLGKGLCGYRLAGADADHWFIVNEGSPKTAHFSAIPFTYSSAEDVLTGTSIDLNQPIPIDADNGLWIRTAR